MTIKGSFNCEGTQFELTEAPASVTRCTCSFCSKRGALWAYLPQAGTPEGGGGAFQLWYNNQNSCCASLGNHLFQNYLHAPSGTQGTPVTFSSQPTYQWAYWPPRNLQPILDEDDVPYTSYTGDLLTQYNYISCNSGDFGLDCLNNVPTTPPCPLDGQSFNGIRCAYINIAADLNGYLTEIANLKPASGSTSQQIADFNAVSKQLQTELLNAATVQQLYKQYNTFYNSLFINNEALLNQMIADAQIESGAQATGSTITLLNGVLYTLIEAAAGVFPPPLGIGVAAIGNITESAINAAVKSGSVSKNAFFTTVSDLWSHLSTDFVNILAANGDNETKILEDSSRSAQTAALITSSGPDSLAWFPGETGDLVAALEPGFKVEAMKILLPSLYWVFPIPQTTSSDPVTEVSAGTPSYDTLVQPLGNGVWNGFAVATGAKLGNGKYPGKQAIQDDVFGNGVDPLELFNNLNGWKFPLWWDPYSIKSAAGCGGLIVSIINQTGDDLTLTFQEEHGNLLGSAPRDLPPYATDVVGLVGDTLRGPDYKLCVSDGSPDDCQAVNYAHFEVQQDFCSQEAGNITYTQEGNRVYQDTQLDQTTGSKADSVPGIVNVAVYNPSASQ